MHNFGAMLVLSVELFRVVCYNRSCASWVRTRSSGVPGAVGGAVLLSDEPGAFQAYCRAPLQSSKHMKRVCSHVRLCACAASASSLRTKPWFFMCARHCQCRCRCRCRCRAPSEIKWRTLLKVSLMRCRAFFLCAAPSAPVPCRSSMLPLFRVLPRARSRCRAVCHPKAGRSTRPQG